MSLCSHFSRYVTREDLVLIVEWTDRRWCNRALTGLQGIQNDRLIEQVKFSGMEAIMLNEATISSLRASLRGGLIEPGDPSYDAAHPTLRGTVLRRTEDLVVSYYPCQIWLPQAH